MRGKVTSILIDDIRTGAGSKLLATIGLAPFFLIILMKFGFLPLSRLLSEKTGFDLSGYYSLIALTVAAIVSAIPGFYFAFISLRQKSQGHENLTKSGENSSAYLLNVRAWAAFISGFILVCLFNIITDPLPGEGPYRMLYASLLLAFQSLTALIFIVSLSTSLLRGIFMSKLYGILLIVIPIGLVLRSPWNILVFFSPYYWISWAWLTEIPGQAASYGAISVGITFLLISVLWKIYRKKPS